MMTASTLDLDRLGGLVSTIGSDRFGCEFYQFFRDVLDIDECTVFSFPADTRPCRIVVEGDTPYTRTRAEAIAKDYEAGGYLSDPNVRRSLEGQAAAIYVVRPQEIVDRAYRQRYYADADVDQEVVLMGKTGETVYYSSFYKKKTNKTFGNDEFNRISALSSIVVRTLHRHSELIGQLAGKVSVQEYSTPPACENRDATLKHLREILVAETNGLSPREAEVCAGIIMGYSSLAISLNCGISLNTVATHRKRAYAKLGISSQNELFVRYFATVTRLQSRQALS